MPALCCGAEYKINSGKFDNRFSSPQKTFALYKKLLIKAKIKLATECITPSRSSNYYKLFVALQKKNVLGKYSNDLPAKIALEDEYHPYYQYHMIITRNGKRYSFPLRFKKLDSGIFLIEAY